MARSFVYEVDIDNPVDQVWQAITDPKRVASWLMSNDLKPAVGHKFQFRSSAAAGSDGIVDCEVLEVTPNQRLVYRWVGGPLMETTVTWELAPAGQGTHVKMTHGGFNVMKWGFVSLFLGSRWKKLDRVYVESLRDLLNKGALRN